MAASPQDDDHTVLAVAEGHRRGTTPRHATALATTAAAVPATDPAAAPTDHSRMKLDLSAVAHPPVPRTRAPRSSAARSASPGKRQNVTSASPQRCRSKKRSLSAPKATKAHTAICAAVKARMLKFDRSRSPQARRFTGIAPFDAEAKFKQIAEQVAKRQRHLDKLREAQNKEEMKEAKFSPEITRHAADLPDRKDSIYSLEQGWLEKRKQRIDKLRQKLSEEEVAEVVDAPKMDVHSRALIERSSSYIPPTDVKGRMEMHERRLRQAEERSIAASEYAKEKQAHMSERSKKIFLASVMGGYVPPAKRSPIRRAESEQGTTPPAPAAKAPRKSADDIELHLAAMEERRQVLHARAAEHARRYTEQLAATTYTFAPKVLPTATSLRDKHRLRQQSKDEAKKQQELAASELPKKPRASGSGSPQFLLRSELTVAKRQQTVDQLVAEREKALAEECTFAPRIGQVSQVIVSKMTRRYDAPTLAQQRHVDPLVDECAEALDVASPARGSSKVKGAESRRSMAADEPNPREPRTAAPRPSASRDITSPSLARAIQEAEEDLAAWRTLA